MNILYLSPWYPYPLDTGFRTRVYYLLRGLAARHSVFLLTLDPKGWSEPEIEPVAKFCEEVRIINKDPFDRGLWRNITRFLSLKPVNARPFTEVVTSIGELTLKRKFDVVIAGSTIMADYALEFANAHRILEEHNSMSRWMYTRYKQQTHALQKIRCFLSWRKNIYYERTLFSKFDKITMVSKDDIEHVIEHVSYKDNFVELVPNGVDCDSFQPMRMGGYPGRLVFSGSLNYKPNLEAVIFFVNEILPIVVKARPGVQLYITGTAEEDLKERLSSENVLFTGFVEDIGSEIAKSVVSIVPILSGGGTRIKILEAMAVGTPVVSTTIGAEGLEVIHGVHLLLADDPNNFAHEVIRLLEDPELRERIGENARRLVVEQYDWQIISRAFVDLVETSVREKQS